MSDGKQAQSLVWRVARLFVDSKLTPLVVIVSLALGAFAIITTPREQDPTISVPAVEISAIWPGHAADEVDERLGRALSAWMREIETVEHVMSAAAEDAAIVNVQFKAGVELSAALSQVNDRLAAHARELPADVHPTIVSRGSADVPVLKIVFWSEDDAALELRRTAREIGRAIERQPNVSATSVIGGARRQLNVRVDPALLAANGMPAERLAQALRGAQGSFPVGAIDGMQGSYSVRAGFGSRAAEDLRQMVVGSSGFKVVQVGDVAEVQDGTAEPDSYVSFVGRATGGSQHSAVVLSVRKVLGSNASDVTRDILASLEAGPARKLLPARIHYEIARDDGEIATEKVQTLLEHMLIATVVVVVLIGLALGRRAALIVGIVIPVTLAFVPLVYKLAGFTLNRITLAAMIFSIGILVDDAIVVVENVHRHFEEKARAGRARSDWVRVTLDAVQEVGSPTILATMTVIAALTPTAFTGGMVGEFLRPLPIGANVAMLYSLVIALTLTPFLAYRMLRPSAAQLAQGHGQHVPAWQRGYATTVRWFVASRRRALLLGGGCVVGLAAIGLLFTQRIATFKNMPVSDVDSLSVIVDLPAGTTVEATHRVGSELASKLLGLAEVAGIETFSGVAGPLTFQGMARGYDTRRAPHQAELQLQLQHKRSLTSHEIAGRVRDLGLRVLAAYGARLTVAEEPMGPPSQAALVAEVYAASAPRRAAIAADVRAAFARTQGVVDVDWSESAPRRVVELADVPEQLTAHGLSSFAAISSLRVLLAGETAAELSLPGEPEPVAVHVQAPRQLRSTLADLAALPVLNAQGRTVLNADLSGTRVRAVSPPILRKDLVPVVYVTGEMAGDASALYAMIDLSRELPKQTGPLQGIDVRWDDAPAPSDRAMLRWGGEWTPTYEMNRDLGVAFVVVLFVIYILLAAWYASYAIPLLVMLPIPLALLGVVPAHVLAGKPLSGMGTIGVIALAGLMVRNSILIVDFAREKRAEGLSLIDATVGAAGERIRPILLTAATVVCGDGVLFFDPLLQGLGLTMASGALASTLLTLLVLPVGYYWLQRALDRFSTARAERTGATGSALGAASEYGVAEPR